MALPLVPRNSPPRHTPQAAQVRSDGQGPLRGRGSAIFSRVAGFVLLGIAVWGIWVAADVRRYAAADVLVPQKDKWNVMLVLLTWLVLFGPFFYFGSVLVRKSFASEEHSWLIPLRVFTYLVGRRYSVEKQRLEFFDDSANAERIGPSSQQEHLDVKPVSSAGEKPALRNGYEKQIPHRRSPKTRPGSG